MLPLGVRHHPKHDAIRKEWLRGRELQFQTPERVKEGTWASDEGDLEFFENCNYRPVPSGPTETFPGDVKPVHEGWYARWFGTLGWGFPYWLPQYWDGKHWCYGGEWPKIGRIAAIQDRPWCGLTK